MKSVSMSGISVGKRANAGFTIIELIVVILLLGILSATALPRFIDVTDDAHEAAVQGVLGGLSTGVALFRAQWTADGEPASGSAVAEFNNQAVNAVGYPLVSTTVTSASGGNLDGCANIWTNLLQGGRPTLANNGVVSSPFETGQNVTYGSTFFVAASGTTCYYIYTARGNTFSAPVITLDSNTGEVLLETTLL